MADDDREWLEDEPDEQKELLFAPKGVTHTFYLHRSIRQPGARDALIENIQANGGEVVDNDIFEIEAANVLLFDPRHIGHPEDVFVDAYKTHSDVKLREMHVKKSNFIGHCIDVGRFVLHVPRRRKPMPGIPPGRRPHRVGFTEEDRENLARYLAYKVPYRDAGGLLGNTIYNRMCAKIHVLPDEYAWTARHTPSSWREHYKKNKAVMNEMMDEIVREEGIILKNIDERDRRLNRARPRVDPGLIREEEERQEEEEITAGLARVTEESATDDVRRQAASNHRSRSRRNEPSPEAEEQGRQEEVRPVSPSLFSEDEEPMQGDVFNDPGPSLSQHSPEPADDYVPPSAGRPTPTHATLVDTLSSPRASTSVKGRALEKLTSSPRHSRHSQAPIDIIEITDHDSVDDDLPRIESLHEETPSPKRRRVKSSMRSRPVASSSQPRPRPRPIVRKVTAPQEDAPYRNLRSRSRSVEPRQQPIIRKGRKKVTTPSVDLGPVLEEEVSGVSAFDEHDIPDVISVEARPISVSEPELAAVESESESEWEPDPQLEVEPKLESVEPELHSDLEAKPEPELDLDSDFWLQPPKRTRSMIDSDDEQTARDLGLQGSAKALTPLGQTVRPSARRRWSTSSEEPFPVPNTKASARKERLIEEAKRMPYVPPPGTRAAMILAQGSQ
ncbi:uncharacterized protein EV420DRAFT_1099499 [Desarmillaria tabescens]|uniref:BRCT domain-containing protein n=1 Tax=Armillaria tabescens TaxID=1929756 RepID=A0AA39T4C4_ARMTA|nr:uncharacterized protein EV420DRAFT_1099499 [Desarmillaria tabescens]KAK0463616.1 hypothetical protein EV420DRAFT_1099499 [Desarmillaria tabescens]